MKIKNILCVAALLLTSLFAAQAQTTITAWTFDNLTTATNYNPLPSTGSGVAVSLGMTNSYNSTNSIAAPDVLSKTGSSGGVGGVNAWRIRGQAAAPNGGNGWSSQAPIGTQGAQFKASTAGYYGIQVSCDVNESAQGERNLQIQYTIDGTNWNNATNITSGGLATVAANTSSANTVTGTYVKLSSSGTGWNNLIKANLSGITGVNNNTNFGIRVVNASTGADCVNASGTALNNTSGNWAVDTITISGTSVQPITAWTFENYSSVSATTPITKTANPLPTTGSGTATALGFNNSYNYNDATGGGVGSTGSQSYPDVLAAAGSSSGSSGALCWRVRGNNPNAAPGTLDNTTGNGWNSAADIGTQGAEFDVNTVNYNTILVTFDLFFTGQAESKIQVEYTTDGTTWTNAGMLSYPANPSLIQTNFTPASGGNGTVVGTYFNMTVSGGGWFNNMTVDLTGVPGVTNNPNFGIRIVNAATGTDCTGPTGGPYNNSSGNSRFDNVVISGQFSGPAAPTITNDPNASVDAPFTNTLALTPAWQYNITSITVDGTTLPASAYNTNIAGKIIFTPSASSLLQSSGSKTIKIQAAGYAPATVVQPIAAGVATSLNITTQPGAPSASGGTLIVQPALAIKDQYGNGTTNPYPNVGFTASVGGAGGWVLGGTTNQLGVNGIAAFTNLSATVNGLAAVSNAVIAFTVTNYGATPVVLTSSSFNIGAPATPFTPGNLAVIQLDTVALNSTFNIIEISPSAANQTSPINIVPISASNGTNSMRLTSSGSAGRLGLSDDGTLLCFVGFLDGTSATTDETSFSAYRGVGTLNYTNGFTCPIQYGPVSVSGGTQGRSACSVDNVNWVIADKNGVFINSANLVADNTRVIRAFGGVNYLMSATTPKTVVSSLVGSSIIPLVGLPTDGNAMDFYMVSANGGYNTLYVLDSKVNTISKYCNISGTWTSYGVTTNADGADSLFATTNDAGGVYLYYTTGSGGTASNSVVRKTDSAGYASQINITTTNTIYTATATTTLKGIAFVPQQIAYTNQPTPTPILTPASGVFAGSSFNVSLDVDDAAWRSAITGITVNGSALPSGAYDTTQSGVIHFISSQSALLQNPGSKTIAISAAGYSADTVIQTINPISIPTLAGVILNAGSLKFNFTNATGLSFSVLATNDITASKANWPVIGTAVESPAGSGNYQFTDPNPATNGARYYLLRQP